jgi:hypothetical protein
MDHLIHDMSDYFKDKLHDLIQDTIDTCSRVDMPNKTSAAIVVAALMHEINIGSIVLEMTEAEFMGMCQFSHRHTAARLRKIRALARKKAK